MYLKLQPGQVGKWVTNTRVQRMHRQGSGSAGSRLPDGASRGGDGADQAPEIRLRNVYLQWGDLGVERPEGRCWSLFFVV